LIVGNFLSAIALPNGEILCDPEHTDSHEDLIAASGLADNGRGALVRVELVPGANGAADADGYNFCCNSPAPPYWWTEYECGRVEENLRERVRRMIVRDDRQMLLGGCCIICSEARVGCIKSARVVSICGNAKVRSIRGTSRVDSICENSQIDGIYSDSSVEFIEGLARVERIVGAIRVFQIRGNAKVGSISSGVRIIKKTPQGEWA
jgi:hypothetical protein